MVSVASHVIPATDRRFFTNMAIAMALVTFAGFAQTYYLAAVHDRPTPPLSASVHLHGALCTAWIVLLIVQTRLIAAGRRLVHMRMGIAGAAIAAGILATGFFVAINSERRVHTAATADTIADPYVFLIFPITGAGLFALFVALALWQRRRVDTHKRLMMLATTSLIVPALARIVTQTTAGIGLAGVPGVVGAVALMNIFIIALAVHDYRTLGRLHRATLWGGAFLVFTEPLRFAIGFSAPWQAFARALMT